MTATLSLRDPVDRFEHPYLAFQAAIRLVPERSGTWLATEPLRTSVAHARQRL